MFEAKLGPPAEERWRSETGELQYRLLWYPQRAYFIVLMGPDSDNAHYIGSADANWRVIHHAELAGRGDTAQEWGQQRGMPAWGKPGA